MQPRGPVIEAARKRRGWKRREFATRLGLSYQHIYGLERGWNTAAEETLQVIADELGLPLDDIAERTPPEPAPGRKATPTSTPVPARPVAPPRETKPPTKADAEAVAS